MPLRHSAAADAISCRFLLRVFIDAAIIRRAGWPVFSFAIIVFAGSSISLRYIFFIFQLRIFAISIVILHDAFISLIFRFAASH